MKRNPDVRLGVLPTLLGVVILGVAGVVLGDLLWVAFKAWILNGHNRADLELMLGRITLWGGTVALVIHADIRWLQRRKERRAFREHRAHLDTYLDEVMRPNE